MPQPSEDPEEEPERTCAGQAKDGRLPSRGNRGEGDHRLIAGEEENEIANKYLASTNSQKEKEQSDAEDGKEGEKKALEGGERRAPEEVKKRLPAQ